MTTAHIVMVGFIGFCSGLALGVFIAWRIQVGANRAVDRIARAMQVAVKQRRP